MRTKAGRSALVTVFFVTSATTGSAQSGRRPGYVIAEVQKTDAPGFDALAAKVRPTLEPLHGRFAVRSQPDMKDSGSPVDLIDVGSFDRLADAETFYNSPAYQAIIPDRDRSAKVRVMSVEDLPQ